jgi:hypothetical protein
LTEHPKVVNQAGLSPSGVSGAKRRLLIPLSLLGLLALSGAGIYSSIHRFDGIVGMTRKNGTGCYCHSVSPTPSVNVWIEGPDSLYAGEEGIFTVSVAGESTRTAGFNVATFWGTLGVLDSLDTYWYEDELTHAYPKPADGHDTVSWHFRYVAPDSILRVVDTIYSVGNSTNQDTMATEDDQWNFGEDFVLVVLGRPTGADEGGTLQPSGFRVLPNYPNPFNPATNIRFELPSRSRVSVFFYDLTGRVIGEIVGSEYPAGLHQVRFTTSGRELASGVYFYRLIARELAGGRLHIGSGKMLLVR